MWLQPAVAPLEKMLKSPSVEEQLAAALPLIALGRKSDVLPTLLEAVRRHREFVGGAARAFPWLRWADRLELYRALVATNPGLDQIQQLAAQFVTVRDSRTVGPLSGLAGHPDLDAQTAYAISQALQRTYFGSRAYNPQMVSNDDRRRAAADARARAKSGPEWRRVIALAMLLGTAPENASDVARSILKDTKASPELRRDAFQILLLSGDADQAREEALNALRGGEAALQKLALSMLTSDATSLSFLRDAFMLQVATPAFAKLGRSGADANALSQSIPVLPEEVTPDLLRRMLKSVDPEATAMAGYALALLGESDGMEALLGYWRKRPTKPQLWDQRVYQAIAQLGEDAKVPVLEQIYNGSRLKSPSAYTDTNTPKDLYWTIRGMEGPNARRLRQRIRSELGMPFLRGEK